MTDPRKKALEEFVLQNQNRQSQSHLCDRVYLLVGNLVTATYGTGTLKLTDSEISFTLNNSGILWGHQLNKLAKTTQNPELKSELKKGKSVELFRVPIIQIEAKFPWYSFNGALNITVNGHIYKFSFIKPNDENTNFSDIAEAKKIATEWKEALRKLTKKL